MNESTLARRYFEYIDAGDYDALADLLTSDFRHVRPDRTFDGRRAFVSFMREDRPQTDTTHVVDAVFVPDDESPQERVAVEGRLLGDAGGQLFAFVDVFEFSADGRLAELRTFTGNRGETSRPSERG